MLPCCPAALLLQEYYSFRVRELAPAALRVLDMQDMHSLRAAREAAAKAGASPAEVLACQPDAAAPDCLRELAAIHRSDLTLVCSPVELELLSRHYGIPMCKLVPAPLFFLPSLYDPGTFGRESASSSGGGGSSGTCSSIDGGDGAPTCPGFSTRQHVMMIGNFRHKPNLDSVREACRLWPLVRQWLPASQQPPELHIYGSYPPGSASQRFHRPREGIHLKGFAPSLDIMLSYRLLLAPLRFGAGLKGKVADSWWHGLPVVTTPVGAEGMWPTAEQQQNSSSGRSSASSSSASSSTSSDPACDGFIWQEGPSSGSSGGGGDTTISSSSAAGQGPWGGLCGGSTAEELAADVATLYCHPLLWSRCQQAGFRLLRQLYDRDANLEVVRRAVAAALERREERRRSDFAGQLLWQQGLRATEYMSRYIELKERVRNS